MAWYPQVQGVDMFAHMRQSEFSARCIDLNERSNYALSLPQ